MVDLHPHDLQAILGHPTLAAEGGKLRVVAMSPQTVGAVLLALAVANADDKLRAQGQVLQVCVGGRSCQLVDDLAFAHVAL